jgi:hypothetical protein
MKFGTKIVVGLNDPATGGLRRVGNIENDHGSCRQRLHGQAIPSNVGGS